MYAHNPKMSVFEYTPPPQLDLSRDSKFLDFLFLVKMAKVFKIKNFNDFYGFGVYLSLKMI